MERALETTSTAVAHVIGDVDETVIQRAGQETRHWLEVTVGIRPEDVILEIGCGVGRVGQAIAPLCKEWIGCDVSPNMLQHSRARFAGMTNARFVEISGYDLQPIADASVDLVYCTVVFMHLDEWDRYNYVLEACRVLRPGGRLFIDNFNIDSDEGWTIFEAHRQIPPLLRPPHIGRFSTLPELDTYFRRTGALQDIRVQANGAWVQACAVRSHAAAPPALRFATLDAAGPSEQPRTGGRLSRLKHRAMRAWTRIADRSSSAD